MLEYALFGTLSLDLKLPRPGKAGKRSIQEIPKYGPKIAFLGISGGTNLHVRRYYPKDDFP